MAETTPQHQHQLEKTWLELNKRSLGYLAYELREQFELTDSDLRDIVNRFYNHKIRQQELDNHLADLADNEAG